MNIFINGKEKNDAPANLAELLDQLGLDPARVVVEYNRNILPRDHFVTTALTDGDELEIVQFVGGG